MPEQNRFQRLKASRLWTPLGLTTAAVLYLIAWKTGFMGNNVDKYKEATDWAMLGASGFFGIIAATSWVGYLRKLTPDQEDRLVMKTLGWAIWGPILAIVAGVALFFVGRWLLNIPSWAAVIIVLLVLILFRRR